MLRKAFSLALAVLSVLVLFGAVASAAPRDKAAEKKINEAINSNFLNTDFDGAEGLLLGTIRACEDKCSPQVLGKAWMYVGVVRGTGRNDMAGAAEAFKSAFAADPNVALDGQVANDPVKALFAKLQAKSAAAAPAETPASSAAAFKCAPAVTEVQTRRAVPLQCETDAELSSAFLHYKTFEDKGWDKVKMEQNAGAWRGTIPCAATQDTGTLKYYVEGLDADGSVSALLGSKDKPSTADIVSETSADPPAYPDEDAPKRCDVIDNASSSESSPSPASSSSSGGTCGAWGEPCGTDGCCAEGLTCNSGTCESHCQADSDCKDGQTCDDGKCEGGGGGGGAGGGGSAVKNLVGIHFGMDLASISSDGACLAASRADHIACFVNGTTYEGTPSAAAPGTISGGLTVATIPILASYERLFGHFGVEARLGFALNGGQTPAGGSAFVPVHAEVRAKYWLLGDAAYTKPGIRPWVHLGGGFSEFDATVKTQIIDCAPGSGCVTATSVEEAKNTGARAIENANATKQLGLSFVTFGGGVMYAVAKNHGPMLNIDLIVPFPSSGFVVEPTLGYEYGF